MEEDSDGVENNEIFYTTKATIAKVIHVRSEEDQRKLVFKLIDLAKAHPLPDPELLLANNGKFCLKCRQRRPLVLSDSENNQIGDPSASSSTLPRPEQAVDQTSSVPAKVIRRRRRTRIY